MKTILTILVAIGMLGLARGDESGERSNLLMRWRVVIQGITLLLFALLLAVMRG